jgi:DNA-binding CsgD family transcriptional regulator
VAVRVALVTAGAILLFGMINTMVIYRYVKLDLYLCLVAVFFMGVGLLWNNRKMGIDRQGKETGETDLAVESEVAARDSNPAPAPVPDGPDAISLLSAKEWQILKLLADGKSNKEIAAVQFVEVSTVKTHLNNIYSKLSVSNRNEARAKYVLYASKWPVVG